MVAARVSLPDTTTAILRPMNLGRDVPQVMALLNLVFAPGMGEGTQRLLSNSLSLGGGPGMLFRLSHLTSRLPAGFVWESDGRIVGTTSLMQAKRSGRFLIANVGVHPDFRRRGIARSLMERCLREVAARHGHEILLQVEQGNSGALRLYDGLGFATVGSMTQWYASGSMVATLAVPTPGRFIRPIRRGEARQALALDHAAMLPDLSWPDPPALQQYESGFMVRLRDMLNGRHAETWVVEDETGRLQGVASLAADLGQAYHLRVCVPPAGKERFQRPLVAKLLRRLRYLRRRPVVVEHPAADAAMADLLRQANFKPRRTLTTMRFSQPK